MTIKVRVKFISLLVMLTTQLPAQTGAGLPKASVQFLLSITGKKGSMPREITAADFSVIDGGRSQNLVSVKRVEDWPLLLGILLDGSLKNRVFGGVMPTTDEEKIVSEFLKTSTRAQDQNLWIKFAEASPNLAGVVDLSDYSGMQQALNFGLSPQAGAELLNTVDAFRGELVRAQDGRRVLIVVANGGTFLGLDMCKRIVEIALRNKIIVYVIDAYSGPGPWGPRGLGDTSLRKTDLPKQIALLADLIKQNLKKMAIDTGGAYLEASNKREMSKVLSQVHEQLGAQYVVTYTPSESAGGDQLHLVNIRPVDRSLTIQAPKGYYVSSP